MSAAGVEVIRQVYDRFNAGDYEGSVEMLHDQVELHQAAEIPGAGTWVGKAEFQRGLVEWLSGFERGFQYEIQELTDCGSCVFARLMLHATGRGSGVEVEREIFNVWEVRDGRGSVCRVYWNEEEARAAAREGQG